MTAPSPTIWLAAVLLLSAPVTAVAATVPMSPRAWLIVPDTPPVGNADVYTTPHETELVVAAPGVLGNDIDAEDDALTARLVTGPRSGSISLLGSGGFRYRPDPGSSGPDTFTYEAFDGQLSSLPALVTVTVGAPTLPTTSPLPTPDPLPTLSPAPTFTAPPTLPSLTPLPGVTPVPTAPVRSSEAPGPTSTPPATASPSPASSAAGAGAGPTDTGSGQGDDPTRSAPVPADVDPLTIVEPDGVTLADDPSLGRDPAIEWIVPTVTVTIPGLVIIVVTLLSQWLGGMAWLPLVRRTFAGDGRTGRRASRER